MLSEIFYVWMCVVLSGSFTKAFVCTTKGRYENTYDPTCKTYYLCNYNGQQLTSTLYKCPNAFDPDIEACSDTYICKRPAFICTSPGYFPDLSDENCAHYYNCFSLFGFFIKFSYSCFSGYQFDPAKRLCSSTYKCESYLSAPQEVRMAIAVIEDPVIETQSSADMISKDLSADLPSLTIPNEEFVCSESGMFPDKLDKNCSAYFYCIPFNDGTFVRRSYKCPNYFDPDTKTCTNNYSCPHSGITVEDVINTTGTDDIKAVTQNDVGNDVGGTTVNIVGSAGRDDTKTTAESNITEIRNEIIEDEIAAEFPIVEDPITEIYSSSDIILDDLPTVAPSSTTLHEDFVCIGSGMFPNKLDKNCSTYFYCIPLKDGTFVRRSYKCPNYFDPDTKKCTSNYSCPYSTTTVENIITDSGTDDIKAITENGAGNDLGVTTENTTDPTGRDDMKSTAGPNTKITTETKENGDSSTDPNFDVYTIELTTKLPENKTEFVCDKVGRFSDYLDESCVQYFLCSRLNNGTFLKTPYKCPKGSYFDPNVRKCSKTYQCHETTITATTNFLNTEKPTTETTNPTPEDIQTTDIHLSETDDNTLIPSTEIVTTEAEKTPIVESQTTIIYSENEGTNTTQITTTIEWEFSCSTVGRFKNEQDMGCKSYFLCSQFRNGTFVKTQYDCPKSSVFSSIKHMCSDMISCVR